MRTPSNFRYILWIFAIIVLVGKIQSKWEFTNLICESLDKQFVVFEYCFLKSINRTYKYMSVKANLLKIPVTKFSVRIKLLKRLNGYKPFLYDVTVDGCKFLANHKINPVAEFFFGFFLSYSNFNHICPIDHDLFVDKLPIEVLNYGLTKVLPFPEGNYLFNTTWSVYGIKRAVVEIFGTLS